MLYVPRHLPNRLEYKVLSCISVHYQSRMASNGSAITPSRLLSTGRVMVLFKVVGYFLYYILIARCWLLFIPYPITGLFDERWTFCGCVAVIGLGDLVTWRHFVRASWGQLSFLL